ncbi:MAG: signal peptidase I [Planctomycetota bacterium]
MFSLKGMLAWIAGFVERHLKTLLIAVALVVLTRVFAVGCYAVRMPSMTPTLIGELPDNDQILVDKLFYRWRPLQRFDVIVFWSRLDEKSYIKRLIGLPGEHLQFRNGNIVIDGQVLRKTLAQISSMKLPVAQWTDGGSFGDLWRRSGKGWEPKDAHAFARSEADETAWLEFRGKVRDVYYDAQGRERTDRAVSAEPVTDLIFDLDVEIEGDCLLRIRLDDGPDRFEIVLPSRGGRFELRRNDEVTLSEEGLKSLQGRHRILFTNVDDRLYLRVDEDPPVMSFDYHQRPSVEAPESAAAVGVQGSASEDVGSVRFLAVRLDRDIHYRRSAGAHYPPLGGDPHPISPGYYFLVGDNLPESRDSRDFGAVPEDDLIGRAFAIYWPWSRIGEL